MSHVIEFALSYSGQNADESQIDLYDVAVALIGFQRSLALTTHLVLNGEIITQAPSLKNARILSSPPEEGSWKIIAVVSMLGTGAINLGTAPKETPLGHLVHSAYDYVVSETMGFHVDYDQTLGQQYEKLKKAKTNLPILSQAKFDSLTEKCDVAVKEMHRPIVGQETASTALITSRFGKSIQNISRPLTEQTYAYINQSNWSDSPEQFVGRVSSYNSNTFKGRIYILDLRRPVSFELHLDAQGVRSVGRITRSLTINAKDRRRTNLDEGLIVITAFKNESTSGRLKSLSIVRVEE